MNSISCIPYFLLLIVVLLPVADSGCIDQPLGLQDVGRFPHHRFTCTTEFNSRYKCHFARLTSGPSWVPSGNGGDDFLQIDLGSVYKLCGLGTKGNKQATEWTTEYKIETSEDGSNWVTYQENQTDKLFSGNTDQNSLVTHTLTKVMQARFVKFIPTKFKSYKALRVELYGQPTDCDHPLGIQNFGISNRRMTSSSEDSNHVASAGRLYGGSTWCSSTSSVTQYLQVDLGGVVKVTAIATQGDPTSDKWVSTYSISYSPGGMIWEDFKSGSSQKKVFVGNKGRNEVKANRLSPPISARYIRINPQTWNSAICVRIELFGCDRSPLTCNIPVGIASGTLPDARLQASSTLNSTAPATTARLNYTAGPSWCAASSDLTPYLQVDLGLSHVVCAVATQGNPIADHWVETFQLEGSTDGSNWVKYAEQGQTKVFQANFDGKTTVKQFLHEVFIVHHVRFLPKRSIRGSCLRVEIYAKTYEECTDAAVGVRWGGGLLDHRLIVTSQYTSKYSVTNVRLRSPTSWAPSGNSDSGDYIQVDLGDVHVICAIATQGSKVTSEWMKTYQVMTSLDGITWTWYRESAVNKTFTANTDQTTVVKNKLTRSIVAKLVRIYPVAYKGSKNFRIEIYGFVQAHRTSLRNEQFRVTGDPSLRLSSSGSADPLHAAANALLYGPSSWCAATGSKPFIRLKLPSPVAVTGIAIQGNNDGTKFVTTFDVKMGGGYGLDSYVFYRNLQGRSKVRTNWFPVPVQAAYVQVEPKTWSSAGICLRMDVFGTDGLAPSPVVVSTLVSNNLTASTQSRITLTCTVYGPINTVIKWISDELDLTSQAGAVSHSTGFLVSTLPVNFTRSSDFTSGGCVRSNPAGNSATCSRVYTVMAYYGSLFASGATFDYIRVYVQLDVPPAPASFQTSDVIDTSAMLTWSQTVNIGDIPIDYFEIEYYKTGSPGDKITVASSSETRRKMIGGLQANTSYTASIRCVFKTGESQWDTVNFKTIPTILCKNKKIGMEKGAIPDLYITSSSQHDPTTPPHSGRLHSTSSWCASACDVTPYLQVDLGSSHRICAVATQGDPTDDHWVQSYRMQFSPDGSNWWYYMENDNVKVFAGNRDRTSVKKHALSVVTAATFVRFLPLTLHSSMACMRVEIYGTLGHPECTIVPLILQSESFFRDHKFTSTSYFNSLYVSHRARLNSDRGWGPKTNSKPSDYLQVDLGSVYTICAVGTKGNGKKNGEFVTAYQIDYSMDNAIWMTYSQNGAIKTFQGNTDDSTLKRNPFPVAVPVRFIRFRPTDFTKYKVIRVEVYGVPEDCKQSLGLESKGIADQQMTSSSFQDGSHGASACRLYGSSSWCSAKSSSNEYLQVDLGQLTKVTGIATQGDPVADKWVTMYDVTYSVNGATWADYTAGEKARKKLTGNKRKSDVVVTWLLYPIVGRYMRIIPQKWKGAICLRVDFYGCTVSCDNQPLGLATDGNKHIKVSSLFNATTNVNDARLHNTAGSWCASASDVIPYLQVDLGSSHVICAAATQGNPTYDQWVEMYTIEKSLDGRQWEKYMENNKPRVFRGNFDRNTVVKQYFSEVLVTRFIRITSTRDFALPCLRIELYGATTSVCRQSQVGIYFGGTIKDVAMTATSSYSASYPPWRARLRGPVLAWAAKSNSGTSDYVQIDMGHVYYLAAIATQGSATESEWTLSYKFFTSLDNNIWAAYKWDNNTDRVFSGNTDRSTVVLHILDKITVARFIRFNPQTYVGYKQIRVDAFGLAQGWRQPLGLENGRVTDTALSASSSLDVAHGVSASRLYGSSTWCAGAGASTYLQVDLGFIRTILGIAIQGDLARASWVTQADLEFGFTNSSWFRYKGIQGNTNNNGISVTWLKEPVGARFVRVLPLAHHARACLKMEVYGSFQVPSPRITSVSATSNITATPASKTTLTCAAYALPYVTFRWLKNGKPVKQVKAESHAAGYPVSNMNASFTDADDMAFSCEQGLGKGDRRRRCRTLFTCQAFYEMLLTSGVDRNDINVFVELLVPTSPINLTAVDILDNAVTLQWRHSNRTTVAEGIIKDFQVEYNTDADTSVVFRENVDASKRSVILSNLLANTSYTVRIRAVSIVGESARATLKLHTTHPLPCHQKSLGIEAKVIPDMYMTSSSQNDLSTPPQKGRLHIATSWCASASDVKPYLQVDLGLSHVICAVATQGNPNADQWVESYQLHYTYDGVSWRPYVSLEQIKTFAGNTNRSSVVVHKLDHTIEARKIRFVVQSHSGLACMRVELYGIRMHRGCANVPVGISSPNVILNHRMTASSRYAYRYRASKGRLGSSHAWEAKGNSDANDYLQVDLGSLYSLCGVATQGNEAAAEWTTEYVLKISRDNVLWEPVRGDDDSVKIFQGNSDQNSIVQHHLGLPVLGRFVRFIPTKFSLHKALRVEVYGVIEACKTALGIENKEIPNNQMTSSSEQDNSHAASAGRLYGGSSWCSLTFSNEYLQVDLREIFKVTGIATQGDPVADHWVEVYSVEYSVDGKKFVPFTHGGPWRKLFRGNNDRSTVLANWFKFPMNTRYCKIVPKKWKSAICLRVELYGCGVSCYDRALGLESGVIQNSQITSSSYHFNVTTLPFNARLRDTAGSWCASSSDHTPYLKVDLGSSHIICAVATQGSPNADKWVQSYELQVSQDGVTWNDSTTVGGIKKTFLGNYDRNTIVKQAPGQALEGRYVRISVKSFYGGACIRLELYGAPTTVCANSAVGLTVGGGLQPQRFSSSSFYGNDYRAAMGRLYASNGWAPSRSAASSSYLQIDLGSYYILCGVATQGSGAEEEWTKTYRIETSLDAENWEVYREGGRQKIFRGNIDKSSVVKNTFRQVIMARFFRLYPLTFNNLGQTRAELYGLGQGLWNPLGIEDGRVDDSQLLASSISGASHLATRSRLYSESAWCAGSSPNSYLEIDIGRIMTITGIATQGLGSSSYWITSFALHFGFTADRFYRYPGEFQGNKDQTNIKVNWFEQSIAARFVRVVVLTANTKACARVDLYGSGGVASPRITQMSLSNNLTTAPDSRATLTCKAYGEPFMDIDWQIKSSVIKTKIVYTNYTITSVFTLNFTTPEDIYSSYNCYRLGFRSRILQCTRMVTCNAYYRDFDNQGPTQKSKVVFIEMDLPGSPSVPSIYDIRSTSVNVSWTLPETGDGSLSYYTIRHSNPGDSREQNITSNHGNTTTATQLTGLTPYTSYNVSVIAVSTIGAGLWSTELAFRTFLPASLFVPSSTSILRLGQSNVTLQCYANGFPVPNVTWTKDGSPVSSSLWRDSKLTETNVSSVLHVEMGASVTYRDSGNYTCHVYNGVDDLPSLSGNMEVLFAPEFTYKPRDVIGLNGSDVTFVCIATGVPHPLITWNVNGSAISVPHSVNGGNLTIRSVQNNRIYEQAYTCNAKSRAGQVHYTARLFVDTSPAIVNMTSNTTAIFGTTMTITCQIIGDPYPMVRWEKDSNSTPRGILRSYNRTIEIQNLTVADEGTYRCVASNRAGTSRATMFLTVLVPPKQYVSPPYTRTFTRGDVNSSINCYGNGKPTPTLLWDKSPNISIPIVKTLSTIETKKVVQMEDSSSVSALDNVTGTLYLRTAGIAYSEAGNYTCQVTNGVGNGRIEKTVEVIFRPIIESISRATRVTEGSNVTLTCNVSGVPVPALRWLFRGNPITWNHTINGGTLFIEDVQYATHAGSYVCKATSRAGSVSQSVVLTIDVPPRIRSIQGNTRIRYTTKLKLNCNVTGVPYPQVYWERKGPYHHMSPFTLSNGNRTLVIPRTLIIDEGVYRCVATNRAGKTSLNATISVVSPVNIYVTRPYTKSYLRGDKHAIMDCSANGYPKVTIYWKKGNTTVQIVPTAGPNGTHNVVQVVQDNITKALHNVTSRLYLRTAGITLQDAGNYTCVADNGVEGYSQSRTVEILFRPELIRVPRNKTVLQNTNVTFECSATGVPTPDVTWSFSGGTVQSDVTSRNLLYIPHVKNNKKFEGGYTCNVANRVGSATASASLTIHTLPNITTRLPETFIAERGDTVIFTCEASGDPIPSYRWYRSGVALLDAELQDSNKSMVLRNVTTGDEDVYTCEAINEEGRANTSVTLIVHARPVIKTSLPTFTEIIVNQTRELLCAAEAIPPANVTWYKDGATLKSSNSSRFAINTTGTHYRSSVLSWSRVSYSDRGTYTCVFTNYRGKASSNTTMKVFVPPRIVRIQGNRRILYTSKLSLTCNVTGVPIPFVRWEKEGSNDLMSRVTLSNANRTLTIARSLISDEGVYRCVVKNRAGNMSTSVKVKVVAPVNIFVPQPHTRSYLRGDKNTVIDCSASGHPKPSIYWKRGDTTIPIVSSVSPNGNNDVVQVVQNNISSHLQNVSSRLYLRTAGITLNDAGNYTCVADNGVKASPENRTVEILFRPELIYVPRDKTVLQSTNATFECNATGVPTPGITWIFSGGAVRSDVTSRNVLLIKDVKNDYRYEGMYTCNASNRVGTASASANLTIHTLPNITTRLPETFIAEREDTVIFKCEASGDPSPGYRWYRSEVALWDAELQDSNKSMVLRNVTTSDENVYTCEAFNKEGRANTSVTLIVHAKPAMQVTLKVLTEVVVNKSHELICAAEAIPPANVTWYKDGAPLTPFSISVFAINTTGTHYRTSVLSWSRVSYSDRGTYTCVFTNYRGKASSYTVLDICVPSKVTVPLESSTVLTEGSALTLHCNVTGVPNPIVYWTKNGLRDILNGVTYNSNRTLEIQRVSFSDRGLYECVSSNPCGQDNSSAIVTVLVPTRLYLPSPYVRVYRREESHVSITCYANAVPKPTVRWFYNNKPLPITKLPISGREANSSVQVIDEEINDLENVTSTLCLRYAGLTYQQAGNYTCAANSTSDHGPPRERSIEVLFIPEFDIPPSVTIVNEGSNATIVCRASGVPTPVITWSFNGGPIIISHIAHGDKLIILNVLNSQAYEGGYTCTARSRAGSDNRTATLTVDVPPVITRIYGTTDVREGGAVNLTCAVEGEPGPQVTWLRDGLGSIPRGVFTDGNRTLLISKSVFGYRGIYTCSVSSRAGNQTRAIEVDVKVPAKLFLPSPSRIYVKSQIDASISCYGNGNPSPSVIWYYNGTGIPVVDVVTGNDRQRVVQVISGNTSKPMTNITSSLWLRVAGLTYKEAGNYTCSSVNVVMNTTETQSQTAEVLFKPEFEVFPSDEVVLVGQPVRFRCAVTGVPSPEITWSFSGGSLPNSTIQGDGNLLIYGALNDATFEGNYTCIGHSRAGFARHTVTLTVHELPKILIPLNRTIVAERGSVVRLKWQATGDPEPTYIWSKNGDIISPGKGVSFQDDDKVLILQNVTPRDNGVYRCTAFNVEGNVTSSANLTVHASPTIVEGLPVNTTVIEKTSLTLSCAAEAIPAPDVTWYKDGKTIAPEPNSRYKIFKTVDKTTVNSTLSIFSTLYNDKGEYRCMFTNYRGQVVSSSRVIVYVPAKVLQLSKSLDILLGKNVTLTCATRGFPAPNVTWLKDNQPLSNRIVTSFKETGSPLDFTGYLQIYGTVRIDTGRYSCQVINLAGSETNFTRLTILEKPDRLVLAIDKVTSSNITFHWRDVFSGNSPILYYTAEFTSIEGEGAKNISVSEQQDTFVDLFPATTYVISVTATNLIGTSEQAAAKVTTLEDVPWAPRNVSAKAVSSTSVCVTWIAPQRTNGNLTAYIIYYWLSKNISSGQNSLQTTGNANEAVIERLKPYSNYSVQVQASTAVGSGDRGQVSGPITTYEDAPAESRNLSIIEITAHALTLKWLPPAEQNGILRYYIVQVLEHEDGNVTRAENVTATEDGVTYTVTSLMAYTVYWIKVSAVTIKEGNASTAVSARTEEDVPERPRNVKESYEEETFTITWQAPTRTNGLILSYKISFKLTQTGQELQDFITRTENNKTSINIHLNQLLGSKTYHVSVQARTSVGYGLPSLDVVVVKTPIREPPTPTISSITPKPSTETVLIFIPKFSDINGPLKYYQIIVVIVPTGTESNVKDPKDVRPGDLVSYCAAHKSTQPAAYLAFQFHASKYDNFKWFTLGVDDKKKCGKKRRSLADLEYYNGPLEPNKEYKYFTRGFTDEDKFSQTTYTAFKTSKMAASTPEPGGNVGAVVGAVFAVLIVLVLLIAGIILYRRRQNAPRHVESEEMEIREFAETGADSEEALYDNIGFEEAEKQREPIKVEDLKEYYLRMHADVDMLFEQEYKDIKEPDFAMTRSCDLPINKPKNRYANIKAYDHSRVFISRKPDDPDSTDYINANYIDGYKHEKRYIATIGPKSETVDDFWRMIWEQNSPIIVMLTKPVEKGKTKCHKYWPDESQTYGDITVTLDETEELADFEIRTFSLQKLSSEKDPMLTKEWKRTVTHFFFTSWPDHDVPEYATGLLEFWRRVKKSWTGSDRGPITVHCSAGVGRTGTFIVIDAMMEQIQEEGQLDVYSYVCKIRSQRNYMVQRASQYSFIHYALLEATTFGDTEIYVQDLRLKLAMLTDKSVDTGQTGMERQFELLNGAVPDEFRDFATAQQNINTKKNRYTNALPYERTRVVLPAIPGKEDSTYINASYLEGYQEKVAYIATQAPLEHTINNFWRMVWNENVYTIVMLCGLNEPSQMPIVQYWPKKEPISYSRFLIEKRSQIKKGPTVIQEFNLTNTETAEVRKIHHFMYLDWPEYKVPTKPLSIIDLIGEVQKARRQNSHRPTIVHCSDGVGRTGTYCTLSSTLERVKLEGVLDVFTTTRMLRTQRPGMVKSLDQYQMCYEAILLYLDSFEESQYQNFM